MDLRSLLMACPVVSILRGIRPSECEAIGAALLDAGVRVVEVPLNSPEPLSSISLLARQFGDRILVGAGTVMAPEQVTQVANAGGRLIVTPHADIEVLRAAKNAGLIAIPGAFNPTEVFALLKGGADAVKLFPAEVLGVGMLRALRAVLPADAMIIPVGGVDAANASSWIDAGAQGLGIGSSLYKPGDSPATVRERAETLISSLRSAGKE